MIKVLVNGAMGRMGKEVVNAVCECDETQLTGAVDIMGDGVEIGGVKVQKDLKTAINELKPDVVVDFTQPSAIFENAKLCLKNKTSVVIGTTGLSDAQIDELEKLSKENGAGCLIAPNFSTGAVLMMKFAKLAAAYFDNAEIIELHHNQKKDAPSGTAIKTAQLMAEANDNFASGNCAETETISGARGGNANANIHIHSVRMPGFMASQEVIFGAMGQTLKIRHDSTDRKCYMPGVLLGVKYIAKNKNFVYGLDKIMN